MIKKWLLFLLLLSSTVEIQASLSAFDGNFYVNHSLVDRSLTQEEEIEIKQLATSLAKESEATNDHEYFHVVKEILDSGKFIQLEDGSLWSVGSLFRKDVRNWQPKQRVRLIYHSKKSNNIQIENIDNSQIAWGMNERKPEATLSSFILRFSHSFCETENRSKLILDNGYIFKGPKVNWKVRDQIFVFHSPSQKGYVLWNLSRDKISHPWQFVGDEKEGSTESILNVEDHLNQHVLGQKEAIKNVSSVLFNCWAGLNDPKLPIGVFLFLGPSGVGKTELAKALAKELYKSPNSLIRFDMSQFATEADYTRLIGSPPGYVNHEEGGQLTEAIKAQPASILLLDEIEKAHPVIRKAFLPIFDEGYIVDSKNKTVQCNRVIFILTGNICSEEIAYLFHEGYTSEEIVRMIESEVISRLSPELYNRLTTVVFRPITPEVMENLVNQKLAKMINQLKQIKNISLIIDDSVVNYLVKNGYHPSLGVRPLNRLIQNNLISFLSYAIIKEGIPEESTITLSYFELEESWNIEWTVD